MMSNNSITPHLSHHIDRKKYNIYILNVYIYIISWVLSEAFHHRHRFTSLICICPSGESYLSSQPKTEETHPVDIAVQNVRMDGYEVSRFVKTTSPSKELTYHLSDSQKPPGD